MFIRNTGKKKWPPTPVFLPGQFHRQEEPGNLQSMGLPRVRHDLMTEDTQKILVCIFLVLSLSDLGITVILAS